MRDIKYLVYFSFIIYHTPQNSSMIMHIIFETICYNTAVRLRASKYMHVTVLQTVLYRNQNKNQVLKLQVSYSSRLRCVAQFLT